MVLKLFDLILKHDLFSYIINLRLDVIFFSLKKKKEKIYSANTQYILMKEVKKTNKLLLYTVDLVESTPFLYVVLG